MKLGTNLNVEFDARGALQLGLLVAPGRLAGRRRFSTFRLHRWLR